jgi:hypothetical protein
MNPFSERSGGVILTRMRALLIDAGLPKNLWPAAASAAVWIINRTPTYDADEKRWFIPWIDVMTQANQGENVPRLNLSNLRLYGCLVYAKILDTKIKRKDKMAPRAEVGYLVGYSASNIWNIWFPERNRVEPVRDAIFDEARRYSPHEQSILPIPQHISFKDPPNTITEDEAAEALTKELNELLLISSTPYDDAPDDDAPDDDAPNDDTPDEISQDLTVEKTPEPSANLGDGQLLTPQTGHRHTQRDAYPDEGDASKGVDHGASLSPTTETYERPKIDHPNGSDIDDHEDQESSNDDEVGRQLSEELRASPNLDASHHQPVTTVSADLDPSNIITTSRKRKAPIEPDFYNYHVSQYDDSPAILAAFATGLLTPRPENRIFRDDLPTEPANWKEVQKHPFREYFMDAAQKEIDSLQKKGAFNIVQVPNDQSKQVIPLKWVFTYKLDANGFLTKFKARICVRGDLQKISPKDKRAATLAAKTARAIFALVAAYDLDMIQLDAVTAFLNAELDSPVYTRLPDGFFRLGFC